MQERGVPLDHAPSQRWVVTERPLGDAAVHRRQHPVWVRWRLDATDIKGRGPWYARSRAAEKQGPTRDGVRTEPREKAAA